ERSGHRRGLPDADDTAARAAAGGLLAPLQAQQAGPRGAGHRRDHAAHGRPRAPDSALRPPGAGLRPHAAAAGGGRADGDGLFGGRRLLAGGLRGQDLADLFPDLRRDRAAYRSAGRPDGRVLSRDLGRVDRDARRGQPASLPVLDPGPRDSGDPWRRPGLRHDRHRHRFHTGVRQDHARPGPHRTLPRLRGRRQGNRHRARRHHAPPRPPELPAAAPGPDDPRRRLRHHRGGDFVFPRPRRGAGPAELGIDALPGPVVPDDGLVDGVLPRHGDLLRRPRLQPPRRRRPRGPRPQNLRL
ncbi:MAG: ABC transporter, permease protein 2 (cluster 5, nickel/peptides/opines), partial [uncultured Rubrobacteraceae bacterium]